MKPTLKASILDVVAKLSMDAMFLTRWRITAISSFPIMEDFVVAALPMWKFTEVQVLRKLLYL